MVTYLKYHKRVILEFTSKMLKVLAVEDLFLWHQQSNLANNVNSCKELDALTGKRIKSVA